MPLNDTMQNRQLGVSPESGLRQPGIILCLYYRDWEEEWLTNACQICYTCLSGEVGRWTCGYGKVHKYLAQCLLCEQRPFVDGSLALLLAKIDTCPTRYTPNTPSGCNNSVPGRRQRNKSAMSPSTCDRTAKHPLNFHCGAKKSLTYGEYM